MMTDAAGNAESPPRTASVVTTVFNRAHTLERAMRSVLEQTYDDFEYIVVDDGSTDDSVRIAESFHDPRIRVERMPHRGRAAALNTAFSLCRGEFILIQDSDDVALPGRFEKQIGFLRSRPDVGMVGCQVFIVEEGRKTIQKLMLPVKHEDICSLMFVTSAVAFCASCIRKAQLLSPQPFDESMPAAEDYDFQLNHLRSMRFHNLTEILQKKFTEVDSLGQVQKKQQDQLTRTRSLRFLQQEEEIHDVLTDTTEIQFQQARVEYYYGEMRTVRRILGPMLRRHPWHFRYYRYFLPSLLGTRILGLLRESGVSRRLSSPLRLFRFSRKHFLP